METRVELERAIEWRDGDPIPSIDAHKIVMIEVSGTEMARINNTVDGIPKITYVHYGSSIYYHWSIAQFIIANLDNIFPLATA